MLTRLALATPARTLTLTCVLTLALAPIPTAQAQSNLLGLDSVATPFGPARIEGDWRYPDTQRLVIGDRVVVQPTPDSAQQIVWIEATLGELLLVGLASSGNGCFTEYVWVHIGADQGLRTTPPFGTCGIDLDISFDSETVTVTMDSMVPAEGRLAYVYDGRVVREQVLGLQESHSGPGAGARNWIGHAPSELFRASDWREPLVALIGPEAYAEAQELMDFSDVDGMQLSNGWVAGLVTGHRASSIGWAAVAINEADRRLLVVLGRGDEAPRMWGDARGPLPDAILRALLGPY